MAIVLPVHSHIGFNNCTENEYENHCQGEEEQTSEEIADKTESNVFIYNGSHDQNAVDNSRQSHHPLKDDIKCVGDEERDLSMDLDDDNSNPDEGSCHDLNQKPNSAVPLTSSGENESVGIKPTTEIDNSSNTTSKDQVASVTGDNYWLMDNEIENELADIDDETRDGSDNSAENLAFLSSIMEMDTESSIAEGDRIEPNESPDPNDASPINDGELHDPKEDEMEVEIGEVPVTEDPTSAVIVDTNTTSEVETPKEFMYGGLENLGNTCYMASAIQLLCGLDSFPTELKNKVPPENNDDEEGITGASKSQPLRDALLHVMDRLKDGETVRPGELKQCIDSRTSLFLGYHQQDSHEFLTTLLDIIDEDYKKKPKAEESAVTEENENDEDDENNEKHKNIDSFDNDYDKNENDNRESDCGRSEDSKKSYEMFDDKHTEEDTNGDENDCVCNADDNDEKSLQSAVKRQKIVEDETSSPLAKESSPADAIESEKKSIITEPVQRSKSYSQFMFSDIESLLHDKDESPMSSSSLHEKTTAKQDEPQFKLAGGRMSTVGVELTRFVKDGDLDENVRPTGASLDKATPQQQIIEGDQHEEEEEGEGDETSVSPVSSNFTTKVRVCLTCESCKYRRSHTETYLHLSLDIATASNDDDDIVGNLGVPSSSSIEEGLRRFFAPEKRDIKCEKCFHTSALQTTEITQLPRNLLFHLKRFIVDVSPDYSSISYRKDQSPVAFEERMNLDASTDDDGGDACSAHDDEDGGFRNFLAVDCSYPKGASYEIRSVVNHIGSSASCGHYTADAKRRRRRSPVSVNHVEDDDSGLEPPIDDREWMRFNDSYVSKISSKEAVEDASQTAYMIMYELVQ